MLNRTRVQWHEAATAAAVPRWLLTKEHRWSQPSCDWGILRRWRNSCNLQVSPGRGAQVV